MNDDDDDNSAHKVPVWENIKHILGKRSIYSVWGAT